MTTPHWATPFFAGKPVLVVGGTSGIGLAIATAFRDAGADVAATGATEAEVASASAANTGMSFSSLSVRDPAAIAALAARHDRLAVLVDCAGVNLRAAEFTEEGFTTALDINLTGAMRLATAFRPALAKGGAMLAIGSMFSFFGAPHAPAYAASKAGLVGLVKSLAVAFAPDGIRVNAVAPGTAYTDIHAAAGEPDRPTRVVARVPMGRIADPSEIAAAILWLLSDEASYVTATVLRASGGL